MLFFILVNGNFKPKTCWHSWRFSSQCSSTNPASSFFNFYLELNHFLAHLNTCIKPSSLTWIIVVPLITIAYNCTCSGSRSLCFCPCPSPSFSPFLIQKPRWVGQIPSPVFLLKSHTTATVTTLLILLVTQCVEVFPLQAILCDSSWVSHNLTQLWNNWEIVSDLMR